MGSFSGYTLCANILTYSSSENNRGSIADKIIVESYFGSKVNFQTNYIREDPQNNGFITKDRFERELDNAIAITKEKRYPTLIVVIASHGSEVNVNGKLQQHVDFYDETVSIDDVLFKKLWDSDLENVEKIVWLEMCRVYHGNNDTMIDVGISIKLVNDVKAERFGPANENADANVNVTEHINPNLPPNCVMLFGAPSGKYSYTNPSTGSHSLLALKTVMQGTRRNEEISVLSLLTKVIWDMSKHNFEADLGDENNPVIKHLSNNGSVIHRLTKEMKLNIVKD